jgi:glycosyltransferase involved in cell wall biosynthesis
MKLCIIIPVFNEEGFIEKSIKSIINQTVRPDRVIYVNDSSTDNTKELINDFSCDCDWIDIIDYESKEEHIPGRKVIEAFNFGLKNLKINYDVICKFDGDIELPKNYIKKIKNIFLENSNVGIAGGNLYISKKGK